MNWLKMLIAGGALWAAGACGSVWAEAGSHRIGVGAHYWVTLDDLNVDEVDEDGFSWVASYQYRPSLVGVGLDVEWKEKGFAGSAKDVFEPQAYLIVGQGLYAAAGIGGYYSDGEFAKDPFYLFRAGFDLEVLPSIHLDLHAIYRFETWDDLRADDTDVDSDTVTLGAAVRIAF